MRRFRVGQDARCVAELGLDGSTRLPHTGSVKQPENQFAFPWRFVVETRSGILRFGVDCSICS